MNTVFEDNTTRRRGQSHEEWRKALRAEMLARRAALPAEKHRLLSAQIVAHLTANFSPRSGAVVGFCWPIRQEPDIRAALTHWCDLGIKVVLPVVVAPKAPLRFRAWTPETPMMSDLHGIPTSGAGDWLTPEVLLLPLNAFDAAGYRLGYGGGYFDRTLAILSPRPLCIGVGFEINRVDNIRPQVHDQKMDWIVTENGAFSPCA